MTERDGEVEREYSFSSANTRLRRGKRSKHRSVKSKQEKNVSIETSSPILPPGEESLSRSNSNSIKISALTAEEHALDLPSKQVHDSVASDVKDVDEKIVPATSNDIDKDENNEYATGHAAVVAVADCNDTADYVDLSEVRIMNTRKPWEKEIMTKSTHSRSSRRNGSRSERKSGSRRSGNSRNGSRHSVRSTSIGSRNISRSSHCSSARTMASSLDTTNSDLDSLNSNDDDGDSYHDLLSDSDDDYYQHRDQQAYLKYRQYLSSSDDDDDDIGEYDDVWREQSQYDQRKSSNKLGAPPSLSYSYRYSAAAEELYDEAFDTMEWTESTNQSPVTTTATPSTNTIVGESTKNLLSPTGESNTNKICSHSNQQQQLLATGLDEEHILSSLMENHLDNDTLHADDLISNHDPHETSNTNQEQLNDQEINSESSNNDDEDENFSDPKSQSNHFLDHQSSRATRQVFWATELSKQFGFESEDLHSSGMPLVPDASDDIYDDSNNFSEVWDQHDVDIIEPVTIHSERITVGSSSSTSTMRSSQRCQGSDRDLDVESSLISQFLKDDKSNSSSSSSSTSRSSKVTPKPRISGNKDDGNGDIPIQTTNEATATETLRSPWSPQSPQASTSSSSSSSSSSSIRPEDDHTDSNGGFPHLFNELKNAALEASISPRSNYQNNQQKNDEEIIHRAMNSVSKEQGYELSMNSIKVTESKSHPEVKAVEGQPQLSGEDDPEIGVPRSHEPESVDVRRQIDVLEAYRSALGPYQSPKHVMAKPESAVNKNSGSSSDDYSNCLMDYSISYCPTDNLPVIHTATNQSHLQSEISNLSPIVRKRRCIVRGIGSFFAVLGFGMALYFLVWFNGDNAGDERYREIQIDSIFEAFP